MKVKLARLVNSVEALNKLMQDERVPARQSLRLARISLKLQDELETFNSQRQRLFEKYGKVGEGGALQIDPKDDEALSGFRNELESMLDEEIEIECKLLSIGDFESANVTVSPGVLAPLSFFFEEED